MRRMPVRCEHDDMLQAVVWLVVPIGARQPDSNRRCRNGPGFEDLKMTLAERGML